MIIRNILGPLFILIGIMMLFQSIRNIYRISETHDWIQTEASVSSIEIGVEEKVRGNKYYLVINYSFVVNDQTFSGNRISFESGMVYNSEGLAQAAAEKYLNKEDKSKLTIYYDPESPYNSVIERGEKKKEYPLLAFGLVFLLIGVVSSAEFIKLLLKK